MKKPYGRAAPDQSKGYDFGVPAKPQTAALKQVQRALEEKGRLSPEVVAGQLGRDPKGYGNYQSFGDVVLEFLGAPAFDEVTDYRRELDILRGLSNKCCSIAAAVMLESRPICRQCLPATRSVFTDYHPPSIQQRTMAKPTEMATTDDAERKYRAPALEKGLDILELLAREGGAMTTSQIAAGLERSVSELFRMVLTLEARGYIAQSGDREGYALTNKLFSLGMAQAPTKTLIEIALPHMKELARDVAQSCHLVVASGEQIVVVARIESPRDLGFSVRVGYRRRIVDSTSGQILFGFQSDDVRQNWMPLLAQDVPKKQLQNFIANAEATAARGYVQSPSDFVAGVTDLSAPVFGRHGILASLTVPYVECAPVICDRNDALERLLAVAAKVSSLLADEAR